MNFMCDLEPFSDILLTGYDIARALQEQLSTHQKQEQKNSHQIDQLTFRDAHPYITLQ